MPTRLPKDVRQLMEALAGQYASVGQDIDSIKHLLRGVQWRLDAVVSHLAVKVQPDVMEPIVNPDRNFINKIITEARFAGLAEAPKMLRRKPRKSQKRRRYIRKIDAHRKKKQ